LPLGPIRRPIGENGANNFEPAIVAKTRKDKRRIAAHMAVFVAQKRLQRFKNGLIAKLHELLSHLKLLPEDSVFLELLNKVSGRLTLLRTRQER
jgi:hypothetical protein